MSMHSSNRDRGMNDDEKSSTIAVNGPSVTRYPAEVTTTDRTHSIEAASEFSKGYLSTNDMVRQGCITEKLNSDIRSMVLYMFQRI
jgi:hypothetical protein